MAKCFFLVIVGDLEEPVPAAGKGPLHFINFVSILFHCPPNVLSCMNLYFLVLRLDLIPVELCHS